MKQWILLVLVLLVGSAALGSGLGQWLRARPSIPKEKEAIPPHWTTGAPPLRLRVETWDIGSTPSGKQARRRIEIRNESETPWTLRHLHATCSCATATLSEKVVPPGGTAWLEVTYRAPDKAGPVAGHVMVEFAEPGSAVVQVNLSAVVAGAAKEGHR